MGFFDKLKQGLGKTKMSFDEKINGVLSTFRKVDEELLDELEEALIMSDIGMDTSLEIISKLRQRVKKENIKDAEEVKNVLREEMRNILEVCDNSLKLNTKPSVILVVRSKWSSEKQLQLEKLQIDLKEMERKLWLQQQIHLEQQLLNN